MHGRYGYLTAAVLIALYVSSYLPLTLLGSYVDPMRFVGTCNGCE